MKPVLLIKIIAAVLVVTSVFAFSNVEPNAEKVPVFLYHARPAGDVEALEQHIEFLHQEGFKLVPVYHIVMWRLGMRNLPKGSYGITLDDGWDLNYIDIPPKKSVHRVLEEFHDKYPQESPHVSLFVIASRAARSLINPNYSNDNWWGAAQNSPYMEVYNHGTDHDHKTIQECIYDPLLDVDVPVAAYADGVCQGAMNPGRINNYASNTAHITAAAKYIASRIGVWPDLFAHPMGYASDYTINEYLPNFWHEHMTTAAFCIDKATWEQTYVKKTSPIYCLPRFTYGHSFNDVAQAITILQGTL